MFDVGGQRDERRKWIQCFNGETSVLSFLEMARTCSPRIASFLFRVISDALFSSSFFFRRHCYHLCGGQQQLQHGNKGRQQHQQATRSSGPLPQYLEQQVSPVWAKWLILFIWTQDWRQSDHTQWNSLTITLSWHAIGISFISVTILSTPQQVWIWWCTRNMIKETPQFDSSQDREPPKTCGQTVFHDVWCLCICFPDGYALYRSSYSWTSRTCWLRKY